MIKAPYSLPQLDILANNHFSVLMTKMEIYEKLDNGLNSLGRPLFLFIQQNLPEIITGRPHQLENLIPQLEALSKSVKNDYRSANLSATTREVNKWFNNLVFSVFNYDYDNGFTQRLGGQLVYTLSSILNLNSCLYCNAQFTFTVKEKGLKTRPQFDHFLNKSRHPYFALSFYNLIPSCYVCNANLKGSKPFSIHTHLHPYIDSIEQILKFRTNISSADFLLGKKDFEIGIVPNPNINADYQKRAENSIGVFAILQRYKFHKDYAGEIIKAAHVYTETTIKDIFLGYEFQGQSIFKSEAEIIQVVMGSFLQPEFHHKRILSKLSTDIANEFGLNI